jgi:MarR-like DNA-binding transcriptional regulator SgrR of sgrS sRNA
LLQCNASDSPIRAKLQQLISVVVTDSSRKGKGNHVSIMLDSTLETLASELRDNAFVIGKQEQQNELLQTQEGQLIMELKRALRIVGLRKD